MRMDVHPEVLEFEQFHYEWMSGTHRTVMDIRVGATERHPLRLVGSQLIEVGGFAGHTRGSWVAIILRFWRSGAGDQSPRYGSSFGSSGFLAGRPIVVSPCQQTAGRDSSTCSLHSAPAWASRLATQTAFCNRVLIG